MAKKKQGKKKQNDLKNYTLAEEELIKKLTSSLELSNQEAFDNRIEQQRAQFLAFVERPIIKSDDVILLLRVSAKICKSTNPKILSIIQDLVNSQLVKKQLDRSLLHFAAEKDIQKSYSAAIACLEIFDKCTLLYPKVMVNVDLGGVQKFMNYFNKAVLNRRMEGITKRHYHICCQYRHQLASDATEITTRNGSNYTRHMPLEDFRRLSTVPTVDDIHPKENIPLRPLIEKGSYESGEEYLDMHYRLIREDLIGPLRQELREREDPKPNARPIYVYKDIQILYPMCSHNGITFRVCFDTADFVGFPWQYSKKLIFGSLLCITKDNFKTCIFGIVANREVPKLYAGLVDLRFPNKTEFHNYTKGRKYFDMVECPSFFEAYRHVLDSFKELNPYSIPFSKYIVHGKTDIGVPKYLKEHFLESYNISSVLGKNNALSIPIKQLFNEWKFNTDLNASQMYAVKHAITSEFSVIQGPPGTGKTFCALRIAHCLLQNERLWNKDQDKPMLIVCYTNHALDQFLTGLSRFGYEKIVRVGGRLSEELMHFSLKSAVEKFRRNSEIRDTHKYLRYIRKITNDSRDQFAKDLGPYMKSVKSYKEALRRGKLVKYIDIAHCISEEHRKHFDEHEKHCSGLRISILDIFLDLCKIPLTILNNVSNAYVTEEDHYHNKSMNETEDQTENQENEELIDVYAEGNALEDRWVFDPDEYKPIVADTATDGETELPEHNQDLFVDNEGFRLVTKSKYETEREVVRQLNKVEAMDENEADRVKNPWKLSVTNKWRLYKYWLNIFLENYNEFIDLRMQQYEDTCHEATRVREEEHEIVLKQASVIAMTTTCAGRYRHVLRKIKPRVVIVEEAAEVLEAHVLTSLVKEVEHCILIGDHKQLRPNPSLYELSKSFNLELSLFERMVNNGMECPVLNVQHRMRPEISLPLRHIYPSLMDHQSVFEYERVKGVTTNLYFINHSEKENVNKGLSSKANRHEAKFIKSLCLYFLLQGYEPSQITVLTGYSGQLMQLRSIMPKWLFEGVRVTTVDNFQGEENDIILLSLVRSNNKGIIGFLGIENRICVALSRAKKGFYVIGNFDLLRSKSELWNTMIEDIESLGCIGPSLQLVCQNHLDTFTNVSCEKDFEMVSEGGCNRLCNYQLPCSHHCREYCHPYDVDHVEYICKEKCLKKVCDEEEHSCEIRCHFGESCPPCSIPVEKYFPECDHLCFLPCSLEPTETFCIHPCENVLECGHVCPKACGENCIEAEMCHASTEKKLGCGHTQMIECKQSISHAICETECTFTLECGHTCQGNCYECYTGNFHEKCKKQCERILPCLHQCQGLCGVACPPCESVACVQSRDLFQCDHKMLQSNGLFRCDEKCSNIQDCGHTCSSVCGEPCFCVSCILNIEEKDKAYITIDCGHVFEVEIIDNVVGKLYSSNSVDLPKCPDCNAYIRMVNRYRPVINHFLADVKAILKFAKTSEQKRVAWFTNKAYDTCRVVAQMLVKNRPKEISQRDLKDYEAIVQNTTLADFKKNLDLRYLARKESKSYLALLTERLVDCRHLIDAHRIGNQIELINYIFQCIHHAECVRNGGIRSQIIQRFVDLLPDVCDPFQTFQESRDLLTEVKSLGLAITVGQCLDEIQRSSQRFRGAKNANAAMSTLMSENLVSLAQYKAAYQMTRRLCHELSIRMFNPQAPFLSGRTYDSSFRKWKRCSNRHIFYVTSERKNSSCPKCNSISTTDKSKSNMNGISDNNHNLIQMMSSLSLADH